MTAHKTSAWPLAQAYVALIVYASLYPFEGWRIQGIAPWAFLSSPWPRYWTGFDMLANAAGYAPLGFLLALAFLRRSRRIGERSYARVAAFCGATLLSAALSFAMEAAQTYLPSRVPSNLDFGLNVAGALGGAALALGLEWAGGIARWSRFREVWFVPDSRGALVLLVLWPFALLFPAAVPLGLGQVFERVETGLTEWLEGTPFLQWVPVREVELQPLGPGAELLCVALGALLPCLLAFSVTRSIGRRIGLAAVLVLVGVGATALSTALSWGPVHAWAWLSLPVRLGLLFGFFAALLLTPLTRRACISLAMLAAVVHLSLLNPAPTGAYFANTLQAWEQGRFIRFNGLAQWLGWLWPYAVVGYALLRVSRAESAGDVRPGGAA